ncbi:MAG: putative Ig domain-containing protein, partial [Pirellulales bacterium]|nr:putative Ig domain-containing protein [Pirellulales bacterium]
SLGIDAPDGTTIDPSSGLFSWTPDTDVALGLHEITVTVTDDGDPQLSDSETFSIYVEPALLASIADQTVVEGETLVITVQPAEGDDFPEGVTLSLDTTSVEGVAFDPETGEFSWTPSEEQGPGSYEFTVRASEADSGFIDDTVTFSVDVTEDNLAPALDPIDELHCHRDQTVSTTITGYDSDLPANTLTFTLGADAPDGATIDSASGFFSWTPGTDVALGLYEITVIVTDDGEPQLSNSSILKIHVEPTLLQPIADQTVVEGETLIVTIVPVDGDEFPENVTLSLDETSIEGVAFDPETYEFSWTPTEEQGPNTYQFTVRANDTDNPDLDDAVTFTVNVMEDNTAPVLNPIDDLQCRQGRTVSATITAVDVDIPTNTLSFSLGVDAPNGATIDPSSGFFSWTTDADIALGVHEITVTVTDDGDPELSDSDIISIYVEKAILSSIPDQSVVEGETLVITVLPIDGEEFPDNVTVSLDETSVEGVAFDPETGEFSWTPTEEQGPGSYEFTVRASEADSGFIDDTVTFTVEVTEENLAPVLDPLEPQTTDQGETIELIITVVDDDLPANDLTFSLGGDAPDGATIDESSGLFSWTPDTSVTPGDYEITIIVSDNGNPPNEDSDILIIRVEPALMESIPDQTIVEGETLIITVLPSGTDEFAESVTLSLDPTDVEGVNFDPATHEFSWTPSEEQGPGTYQFTIRASDPNNYALDDIETFTINVTEDASPPALNPIDDLYCRRGYTLTATITGLDPDVPADDLTFSLDPGDAHGATIDPDTGEFIWVIPWWQPKGKYDLSVTLSDNSSTLGETTATFSVIVNEIGNELVMMPLINLITPEGLPISFTTALRERGPAVGVVSYELGPGAPEGATVSTSGHFSWTPGQDTGGEVFEITIIARDEAATPLETSETFRVFVQMPAQSTATSAATFAAASAALINDAALEELTSQKIQPPPPDYDSVAFWLDLPTHSGKKEKGNKDEEANKPFIMELMQTGQ